MKIKWDTWHLLSLVRDGNENPTAKEKKNGIFAFCARNDTRLKIEMHRCCTAHILACVPFALSLCVVAFSGDLLSVAMSLQKRREKMSAVTRWNGVWQIGCNVSCSNEKLLSAKDEKVTLKWQNIFRSKTSKSNGRFLLLQINCNQQIEFHGWNVARDVQICGHNHFHETEYSNF